MAQRPTKKIEEQERPKKQNKRNKSLDLHLGGGKNTMESELYHNIDFLQNKDLLQNDFDKLKQIESKTLLIQ